MATVVWLAELESRKLEGESRLHLEWLPEDQRITASRSTLTVSSELSGEMSLIRYDWEYEGEQKQGLMMVIFNPESGQVRVAWSDTWHYSNGILDCSGELTPEGKIRVEGHYPAGEGPDWGWRIELSAEAGGLRFAMTNISPDGEESWATDCLYQ